ncbi:MAG: HD domain-containing protein [Methylococcaceae bacterium]|nr:MAG: HD domain-containing protein [Methylococcaceae bacterium]
MWWAGETSQKTQGAEITREVLDDFMDEFHEAHQQCESMLMELERHPDNQELLNSLFRAVHTVKGNLSYVRMNEFMPLLQSLEDVLDDIRKDHMAFDDTLSDVVLLAMDAIHRLVLSRVNNTPPPMSKNRFDEICKAIHAIVANPVPGSNVPILRAIHLLDPETKLDERPIKALDAENKAADETGRWLRKFDIPLDADLGFFRNLGKALENRSSYWQGRTERILKLALTMNEQAGSPVDPAQLATAVFVHDIGMAFLPLEMLHKTDAYNEEERRLVNAHPGLAREMLSRMARWQTAAEIVGQHHERSDGSGYPQGLKETDICDGAKILGIAESFDARTCARAHRSVTKRPFIRAVLEINNCSGQLFPERWVDVFNEAVRVLQEAQESA